MGRGGEILYLNMGDQFKISGYILLNGDDIIALLRVIQRMKFQSRAIITAE